jgi:NADP-dependent 3-hydroxy acid dehydrogenase YdfG
VERRTLKGQVVVITGASSGVGRAIARAAAAQGARVALLARGTDALKATAREVEAAGGESLAFSLDLADARAVQDAANRIVSRWGSLDVWVNDAMVTVFAPVVATSADEFHRVTAVNYLGTVHGTLAALRHMRMRDHGVIVQIGSALAYRSLPLQSAHCASKAAIRAFTDSLRCELLHERSRIRVTMLQLPAVNTPQFDVARNKLGQHARPMGTTYQPEVIARAALYAIEHPGRELWIGGSTMLAILGQRVVPGLLDRYLARSAWDGQVTEALPPTRSDNVDWPLPGDRGAHGPFDAEARSFSSELWLRTHRGTLALVAVAVVALGVAAARGLFSGLG